MTNTYELSQANADLLKGVVNLPHEIRVMALEKFVKDHGRYGLVELFSQFIGLANSVVENNREFIELYLICECKQNPDEAEKINLPTLFGALLGVSLARQVDQSRLCHGCAYRLGSHANQSPSTTCDAADVKEWNDVFWCHEELNDDDTPTRKCRGHLLSSAGAP